MTGYIDEQLLKIDAIVELDDYKNELANDSYVYYHTFINELPYNSETNRWITTGGEFINSEVDALRHSYASAVFAFEFGNTTAELLGLANELKGSIADGFSLTVDSFDHTLMVYLNNGVTSLAESLDLDGIAQQLSISAAELEILEIQEAAKKAQDEFAAANMDLWNNAVGFEVAENVKREGFTGDAAKHEIMKRLHEKLDNGELISSIDDTRTYIPGPSSVRNLFNDTKDSIKEIFFGENEEVVIVVADNTATDLFYVGNIRAISDLAEAYGMTLEEFGQLTGNEFIYDRYAAADYIPGTQVDPTDIPYLYKIDDNLLLTTVGQGTPDETTVYAVYDPDADNQYPSDSNSQIPFYLKAEKPNNSVSDDSIIQSSVNDGFHPRNIKIEDTSTNTTTNYFGVNGNTQEFLDKNFSDLTGLDASGIQEIYNSVSNISYIEDSTTMNVVGQDISFKSVVDMVEKGTAGFVNFMSEVVQNSGEYLENQTPTLIAQIVARVIQGEEIEDVAESIAVQAVAGGAVESIFEALGYDEASGGNLIPNEFGQILDNNVLATEAIKGAITSVAVTAILNGKDAGIEDYALAAANASVSEVISNGITNNGYDLLTETYFIADPGNGIGPQAVNIPTPAGAGAIAAITTISSSLIMGNGVNEDTLRAAATAAGTAAAGTAISTALFGTAATATSAGTAGLFSTYGAYAGPAGIVIGAALGLIIGKIFKPGGEFHYHNQTVGFVVQEVDGKDTIVVVREQGALAVADASAGDIIGGNGHDVLVGDATSNLIVGQGGDDMIEGRQTEDILIAGTGHDHVEAGHADDYVEGNEGNDKIHGDEGNDMILGGSGHDVLSGGTGDDQIEGNEDDDVIYGDSGNDVIWGGSGVDQIHGGAGNDLIYGDEGNDYIDGSIGDDEIYGGSGNDIVIGSDGHDVVRGDSGDDVVYGDAGTDILYGDLGDDVLDGGADADLLLGGFGNDVVFGQDGDDHIYGELDNDYLVGGQGNDILDGGDGDDAYIFGKGDGKDIVEDSSGTQDIIRIANYTADEVTFIKDGDNVKLSAAPDGSDEITIKGQLVGDNIEYVMFSDGKVADMSTLAFDGDGVASYNFVADASLLTDLINQTNFAGTWQEAEEDRQYMSYNTDSSWYFNNFDTSVVTGQTGLELYNDVQVETTVIKYKKWYGRTTLTYHHNDYYEENLVGTEHDDRIVGLWWNEDLLGRGGNDELYGNGGEDIIDGGFDHDIIYGGSQNDTITADTGHDKAYGGMGNDTINGNGGNDSLYGEWGFDTIHGGTGDDMISGGMDADSLYGDEGNDIIYGDEGNDNLYGGAGDDYLVGSEGVDSLNGGDGDDYLEGGASTDSLSGGSGNDILRGGDNYDNLQGGSGDDLLIGGNQGDFIDGGSGNDTISYYESDAKVTINLTDNSASGGYAEGDDIIDIENVIGTDYDDHITGNNTNNILAGGYGNDKLYGLDGDDILKGGAGADIIDGGAGIDHISYADSVSGVDVNFITGEGKFGYAEGDNVSNVENITGSIYDDRFTTNSQAATFEAGGGVDTIVLQGDLNQYEVILDKTTITARRLSDNTLYTFANGERVEFDGGVSYGLEDFPGSGDSVATILKDSDVSGVIVSDNTGMTFASVSNATNGNETINSDGTYNYEPNTGYVGRDAFSYMITNAVGLKRIQHVEVDVAKDVFAETSNVEDGIHHDVEHIVNTHTDNSQKEAHVATLENGDYVITWASEIIDGAFYDIVGQLYSNAGTPIGGEFHINNVHTLDNQEGVDVTGLAGGGFVVTWYSNKLDDGVDAGIAARIYDSSGQPLGDNNEFKVNTTTSGTQAHPEITSLTDGGFVVVWHSSFWENGSSKDLVVGQKFDSTGNKVGDEFYINSGATRAASPAISSTADGGFIIAWEDRDLDRDVFVQRYDSNSAPVGFKITANTESTYFKTNPAVQAFKDGSFVVMWNSEEQDGSDSGLYAQLFNADNSKKGIEFRVNVETSGHQQDASITDLGNGQFMVSWSADIAEIGRTGVLARIYDYEGNSIGEEFVVNDYNDEGQNHPSIAHLGDGSIIATWQGRRPEDEATTAIGAKMLTLNNRVFEGTDGNDIIQTGSGDDIVISGLGNDIIDGGIGSDTISYANSNEAIGVNLSTNATSGGLAVNDQISNFENIIGTGYDDTLTGNAANNNIEGDAGDDVIDGHGGDDTLLGGAGNDNLDGGVGDDVLEGGDGDDTVKGGLGNDTINAGQGNDTAQYINNLSEYNVELDNGVITITDNNTANGDEGTDVLTSIENLQFLDQTITLDDFDSIDSNVINLPVNRTVKGLFEDSTASYEIKMQASNGFVTVNSDNTYSYTPNTDYVGEDSFSYKVTNTEGLSSVVYVTVNVNEAASLTINNFYYDTEFLVNTTTNDTQDTPSVTALTNGNYVITWQSEQVTGSDYDIFGQLYNSSGNPIGTTEFQINNLHTGNQQLGVQVTELTNGGFVAVWGSNGVDGNGSGVAARIYDSSGSPLDDEFVVNTNVSGTQDLPAITSLSDGGFVVVWHSSFWVNGNSQEFVVGQKFHADGSDNGLEFQLSSTVSADNPSISATNNGGFVATWHDGTNVYVKRFDSDADPIGTTETIASTDNTYSKTDPQIQVFEDNSFVVVWTSDGQDGSNKGLYGQLFNSDGSTRGQEFQVHSTSDGIQQYADIADIGGNKFIVTWSGDVEGNNSDILAQIFDYNGNTIGDEFSINEYINGGQSAPTISHLGNNEFIASWYNSSDPLDGSSTAVKARMFSLDYKLTSLDSQGADSNDSLTGSSGADKLEGLQGDDYLDGAEEDDILDGGAGSDVIITGTGQDIVIVKADGDSTDTITDLDVANDKIDLSDFDSSFSSFAELMLATSDDGTDTTIDLGNNQNIVINNVTKNQLTKDNFIGNVTLNALPVAALSALIVDVDESTTIDVLAQANDLDGDDITLDSVSNLANANASVAIVDGNIVYTPEAGFTGSDSFDYTISDDQGGVVTQTLNITVEQINDAPTAEGSLANVDVNEDATTMVVSAAVIQAAFDDVDAGDTLTYSLTVDGTAAPAWLAIDANTGEITSTNPTNDDVGSKNVIVTATDSAGADATQSFTLNVTNVNDAPTAVTAGALAINEDDSAGTVVGDLTVADVDVGDSHTFTVSDSRFEIVDSQLKIASGASFNFETEASIDIDVVATDADGSSTATQTFTVSVLDVAEVRFGDANANTLSGLDGGAGIDILYGLGGNDTIVGYLGDDTLIGGGGNDTLYGSAGNDTLDGQFGSDLLYGGDGNDNMRGGFGMDFFQGGTGSDTYVFAAITDSAVATGIDTITDFEQDLDLIDLSALDGDSINDFSDVSVTTIGANTFVSGNENDLLIKLTGVYALDEDDFVF